MKKNEIGITIVLVIAAFIFISSSLGTANYLVVLSESMKPTINMGDLIVTEPTNSESIKVGDIVAFKDGDSNIPVTHRVVNVTVSGFVTKGDAVQDTDIKIRRTSDIYGRVVFWIPFAGYLVSFARSSYGFIILIIIPGILLIVNELRKIFKYSREGKNNGTKVKNLSMLLLPLILISISMTSLPTRTYFSDTEVSSGNFFSVKCPDITLNKWWSDTNFVPMSDPMYNNIFEVVIQSSTKKVSSTNPGGFFINIIIDNVPTINSIIITDTILNPIRSRDFETQGGHPFHAYLNGDDVSKKFEYNFDGSTLTAYLKSGETLDAGELYVNLHLKYSFIKTSMTNGEKVMFPHTYTNLAEVTIDGEAIQSSADLTANLKWVG